MCGVCVYVCVCACEVCIIIIKIGKTKKWGIYRALSGGCL